MPAQGHWSETLAFSMVTDINEAMTQLDRIWDNIGILEEERVSTAKQHIERLLKEMVAKEEAKEQRIRAQVSFLEQRMEELSVEMELEPTVLSADLTMLQRQTALRGRVRVLFAEWTERELQELAPPGWVPDTSHDVPPGTSPTQLAEMRQRINTLSQEKLGSLGRAGAVRGRGGVPGPGGHARAGALPGADAQTQGAEEGPGAGGQGRGRGGGRGQRGQGQYKRASGERGGELPHRGAGLLLHVLRGHVPRLRGRLQEPAEGVRRGGRGRAAGGVQRRRDRHAAAGAVLRPGRRPPGQPDVAHRPRRRQGRCGRRDSLLRGGESYVRENTVNILEHSENSGTL